MWLRRLSYTYLILPFLLFCLSWLKPAFALVPATLIIWVLWRSWTPGSHDFEVSPFGHTIPALVPVIAFAGLWVVLSGVGGYAFQNWDHHWRNAVLRDLITYDWPVVYAVPERGPIKMLVYYVGYWLPSALLGKAWGWQAANAFLFLWTWLGVLLVVLHLSFELKAAPIKTLLMLVLFSGMDALGSLFFAHEYPTLWPPIQHLEIWAGDLQYSSFTTQLFWVFHQAVPTWLCITVFVVLSGRSMRAQSTQHTAGTLPAVAPRDITGQLILIWALCFFFAPLAALGLLPYLLLEWVRQAHAGVKKALLAMRFDLLLAAVLIFCISYLFFSLNAAAQERGIQTPVLTNVLVFFLLEGGFLWLLLAARHRRDPRWGLTGLLLFFLPFIQLGSGRDFVMRVSIAPLFFLMLWTAEALITRKPSEPGNHGRNYPVLQIALLICLVIGALTPLYEINRSIYRTFEYYFLLDAEQRARPDPEPAVHLEQGGAPEWEHPGLLVADQIQTLAFMDDKLTKNFVANARQSLYYRYIAPR